MKKDLRRLKRALRELRPSKLGDFEVDWSLSEEDLVDTLYHHRGSPLLFGRFEAPEILADLARVGMLKKLKKKGYRNFRSGSRTHVQFEDRFLLLADHLDGSSEHILFDVRTHYAEIEWGERTVRALVWNWVGQQDPKGVFEPDRPPLPGQQYPGLGVFRACKRLFLSYVERTEVDVVVAVPEHFHNAWLYSPYFRFYLPEVEARFGGLIRDLLKPLGLSGLSHALETGDVRDESDQIVLWTPNEQVYPVGNGTAEHFQTETYNEKLEEHLASCSFHHRPAVRTAAEQA